MHKLHYNTFRACGIHICIETLMGRRHLISVDPLVVTEGALQVKRRGWQPLYVPLASKNPGRDGWQRERLTREELEKLAAESPEWEPDQSPGEDEFAESQLPVIIVNGRPLRDIAADAWDALRRANEPPFLFQRGHLLVDIISNDQGQSTLRTLDKPALKGILDRVANFVAVDRQGPQPARPPADVVADLMAAKELPLPLLKGIIQAPKLTPTGTLVTGSGYQPETGFFLELEEGLVIPPIPENPDGMMVAQARSLLLDDLLVDFPFVNQADLANAVAVLLLPFARLLIDGPTPLHLVEAPTPGSGKGLLVDALTIPAAGRGLAVMTEGKDEDEWRKRLTAKLTQGPQFILIDNVRSRLDSAALSAALTSDTWVIRIPLSFR
jgi:putative DNA primase/helicase